ncbi:Hpt domain-containing protein [Roseibium hamelinense]|uniref:Hpt domain-containing protein n=2 Tax=Roseibium hamelinense TaxID=150831 RepID=A0A562TB76_9HYPH|nr:Hpt domain-containing protein [Roseibium hamelinense]TWI90554.1 Hpt domain-containing protein [Roseibium hamelinense]
MAAKTAEGEEYEVLTPPTDLRQKVRILTKREAAKFDPVAAAEAAIQRLSSNFGTWMDKETEDLLGAMQHLRDGGADAERLDRLYQSAHNIKGQALTLGYPLVGSVAASFCHLIENLPEPSDFPMELGERYVEAIRAMVSEGAKDADNPTGSKLLESLTEVSDAYLEKFK